MFFSLRMILAIAAASIGAVPVDGKCTIQPDEFGHVNWPEYRTAINKNDFRKCRKLTSITIPRQVKYIHNGAFLDSGINLYDLYKDETLRLYHKIGKFKKQIKKLKKCEKAPTSSPINSFTELPTEDPTLNLKPTEEPTFNPMTSMPTRGPISIVPTMRQILYFDKGFRPLSERRVENMPEDRPLAIVNKPHYQYTLGFKIVLNRIVDFETSIIQFTNSDPTDTFAYGSRLPEVGILANSGVLFIRLPCKDGLVTHYHPTELSVNSEVFVKVNVIGTSLSVDTDGLRQYYHYSLCPMATSDYLPPPLDQIKIYLSKENTSYHNAADAMIRELSLT